MLFYYYYYIKPIHFICSLNMYLLRLFIELFEMYIVVFYL